MCCKAHIFFCALSRKSNLEVNPMKKFLASILTLALCLGLATGCAGKQTPAFEIMYTNPAIKNLIREAKTHQIDSAIQAGAAQGMCTMDTSLLRLVTEKRVSKETALTHCMHYEAMEKRLSAMS